MSQAPSERIDTAGLTIVPGQPWQMLPPPPGHCPFCAVMHDRDEAHDAHSLTYRIRFRLAHGRDGTWADAVAHCEQWKREHWERLLREKNAWSEPPDGVAPIAEPWAMEATA